MNAPTVKKTLRQKCQMPPKSAAQLDMLMTRLLTRTARYHGLTLDEIRNFAINLGDDLAFSACLLLMRPGIRNKFRKNIREQMLPRMPLYTVEWKHSDDHPPFRTPISQKQIDAVLAMHEEDVFMYITLFHTLNWNIVSCIVNTLPSVEMTGDAVRQQNYNNVVERNSGYNRNERY